METTEVEEKTPPEKDLIETTPRDSSLKQQDVKEGEIEKAEVKKGLIFAKTDFQGVLQTSFVKLFFENQENSQYKFQLHIGEKSRVTAFSWDVKIVQPGYFFIELPAGSYRITSVSIPVGSTMATEDIDINLEVVPDKAVYIGTLKLVGTKEKIKLGGVPVIKPGFEYTAFVIDEREEGFAAFRQNYPNAPNEIEINLMKLNKSEASLKENL